eukprot:CAMPEP_0117456830 /NCGR_PEP_ID=MMETSP0784-20121206/53_1 /TAXON_ID=39447 /ORGANISM="" /LENGTH=315 /DNA_ID=CAMNT_0005250201 /DNA_START=990 /DNA_END=1937 /DNA_ORIENTATION=+
MAGNSGAPIVTNTVTKPGLTTAATQPFRMSGTTIDYSDKLFVPGKGLVRNTDTTILQQSNNNAPTLVPKYSTKTFPIGGNTQTSVTQTNDLFNNNPYYDPGSTYCDPIMTQQQYHGNGLSHPVTSYEDTIPSVTHTYNNNKNNNQNFDRNVGNAYNTDPTMAQQYYRGSERTFPPYPPDTGSIPNVTQTHGIYDSQYFVPSNDPTITPPYSTPMSNSGSIFHDNYTLQGNNEVTHNEWGNSASHNSYNNMQQNIVHGENNYVFHNNGFKSDPTIGGEKVGYRNDDSSDIQLTHFGHAVVLPLVDHHSLYSFHMLW